MTCEKGCIAGRLYVASSPWDAHTIQYTTAFLCCGVHLMMDVRFGGIKSEPPNASMERVYDAL